MIPAPGMAESRIHQQNSVSLGPSKGISVGRETREILMILVYDQNFYWGGGQDGGWGGGNSEICLKWGGGG